MSEKQDLAILFSLLDKPTKEYMASPSFSHLEQEIEVVKHIERFRLPEVNKLICCSSILADLEWTQQYNSVRYLYGTSTDFDVLDLLLKFTNDFAGFEERILSVAGSDIIKKIADYFHKIESERDRDKKERALLKGKITKAKNKLQEESGSEKKIPVESDSKSANELRVEELDKIIEEKDSFLKGFKKHYQATKKYFDKYNNVEQMAAIREQAYAAIDEVKPSREEEFLLKYVESGSLSNENIEELKNYGFVQRFLECFNKKSYSDLAFPVLSKLYEDGAIDFEDDQICQFVNTHPRLLAEFLEDKYNKNPELVMDEDNGILIEYAIKSCLNGCNDYITWWNTIKTPADWKYILAKINDMYGTPIETNVAKLLHHVEGKSLSAFVELMNSNEANDVNLSASELISEYLEQKAPDAKDLIRGYIKNSEQSNRKIQRRLASRERELNRFESDLFSSIYLPLEQLENLAVNLRLSDGEIKCSLVAGQMIQALASLREGLSTMGLKTADEIENWQQQSLIEYDVEKHRMSSPVINPEDKVKLQTLGYAYIDDDGNRKIRAAEVYIPAPMNGTTDKDSINNHMYSKTDGRREDKLWKRNCQKKKGYPRTEQSNGKGKSRKKNRKNNGGKRTKR